MEFVLCMVGYFVQWVGVLMGVAFYTLLERKVLSASQVRVGPNKVGYSGILQPFSDAVKLFTKEGAVPMKSSVVIYLVSPVLALAMPLIVWCVMPFWFLGMEFFSGWVFVFACLGLGVYSIFLGGWSSNSKYAVVGALRAVAQMISYEVVLAVLVVVFVVFEGSYSLTLFSGSWVVGVGLFPLLSLWMMMMMGESQRSPFDLAEGESELVSGFNVEYGGVGFALMFMGEYGAMLFMSMVSCFLFWGGSLGSLVFPVMFWGFGFVYLWLRATFPRVRYDQLMYLAWKGLLPVLLFVVVIGVYINHVVT